MLVMTMNWGGSKLTCKTSNMAHTMLKEGMNEQRYNPLLLMLVMSTKITYIFRSSRILILGFKHCSNIYLLLFY